MYANAMLLDRRVRAGVRAVRLGQGDRRAREPHSAEFVLRGSGHARAGPRGHGSLRGGARRRRRRRSRPRAARPTGQRRPRTTRRCPCARSSRWRRRCERSETVADRLGPSDFNMPWMNARADLIGAQLLCGELGLVERVWPSAWDDALAVQAWEHWLVSGRLAAYRAEWSSRPGRLDDAVTWARRAIELARAVHAEVRGDRAARRSAVRSRRRGSPMPRRPSSDEPSRSRTSSGRRCFGGRPRRAGEGAVDRIERRRPRRVAPGGGGDHPRRRGVARTRARERLPRRAPSRRGPRGRRLAVRLTVFVHTGLVVFCRSLSYGVWPPRPPWGRL